MNRHIESNEKEYQAEIRKKYNTDNIFNKKEVIIDTQFEKEKNNKLILVIFFKNRFTIKCIIDIIILI